MNIRALVTASIAVIAALSCVSAVRASRTDPAIVKLNHRADMAATAKDWALCISIDKQIIARDPKSFDSYYQEAECVIRQVTDKPDASQEDLQAAEATADAIDEKVIALDPTQAEAYYQAADTAFDSGDYPTSIKYNQRLTEVAPHEVRAYEDGGYLMESLGELDQAEAFYKEGVAKNPTDSSMSYQLGFFYFNTKHDWNKAIDAFHQAAGCPDADWNDGKMLAHSQEKAGLWQDAYLTWKSVYQKFGALPLEGPVILKNLNRVENYMTAHNIAPDTSGG